MLEHELSKVLALSVVVALMLQAVKKAGKLDDRSDVYRRLQPTFALLLGAGLGAVMLPFAQMADRLSWGAVAGGFSSGGYSIIMGLVRSAKRGADTGRLGPIRLDIAQPTSREVDLDESSDPSLDDAPMNEIEEDGGEEDEEGKS